MSGILTTLLVLLEVFFDVSVGSSCARLFFACFWIVGVDGAVEDEVEGDGNRRGVGLKTRGRVGGGDGDGILAGKGEGAGNEAGDGLINGEGGGEAGKDVSSIMVGVEEADDIGLTDSESAMVSGLGVLDCIMSGLGV